MNALTRFDQFVIQQAARGRHPVLDLLMRAFSRAGDWQSWTALLIAGFVAGPPYREIALAVTPKLLATFTLCRLIKHFSKRPRPSQTLVGFFPLLADPDPYSFPSAHSACAWSVALSLGFVLGAGWPLWISYAFLISYSRIHVGAHYPLDVLIGTLIGCGVAFGMTVFSVSSFSFY